MTRIAPRAGLLLIAFLVALAAQEEELVLRDGRTLRGVYDAASSSVKIREKGITMSIAVREEDIVERRPVAASPAQPERPARPRPAPDTPTATAPAPASRSAPDVPAPRDAAVSDAAPAPAEPPTPRRSPPRPSPLVQVDLEPALQTRRDDLRRVYAETFRVWLDALRTRYHAQAKLNQHSGEPARLPKNQQKLQAEFDAAVKTEAQVQQDRGHAERALIDFEYDLKTRLPEETYLVWLEAQVRLRDQLEAQAMAIKERRDKEADDQVKATKAAASRVAFGTPEFFDRHRSAALAGFLKEAVAHERDLVKFPRLFGSMQSITLADVREQLSHARAQTATLAISALTTGQATIAMAPIELTGELRCLAMTDDGQSVLCALPGEIVVLATATGQRQATIAMPGCECILVRGKQVFVVGGDPRYLAEVDRTTWMVVAEIDLPAAGNAASSATHPFRLAGRQAGRAPIRNLIGLDSAKSVLVEIDLAKRAVTTVAAPGALYVEITTMKNGQAVTERIRKPPPKAFDGILSNPSGTRVVVIERDAAAVLAVTALREKSPSLDELPADPLVFRAEMYQGQPGQWFARDSRLRLGEPPSTCDILPGAVIIPDRSLPRIHAINFPERVPPGSAPTTLGWIATFDAGAGRRRLGAVACTLPIGGETSYGPTSGGSGLGRHVLPQAATLDGTVHLYVRLPSTQNTLHLHHAAFPAAAAPALPETPPVPETPTPAPAPTTP